ncbi:alpha/beta hydrolase [Lentisphaera profundi]|uniref:Alpha/beta hydrolase n=1 Tax=Lentisphaera profundi TaxID=1658616 RepID=A0ABY7VRV9_9BACT|nr:alpha/beta hydrolase [Lentisphaera profundi]WDE96469.1 alpha/beta hydrolase [Lentisphaera profundi]
MKFISLLLISFTVLLNTSAAPIPSKADLAYGKHARNKMDFWQAESSNPTPVLVFFHGGGFKNGDKNSIHKRFKIDDYLKAGVSCVSVNYPFLKHTNMDYMAIMKHCQDSIEFIKTNSEKWNIDPKKIAASGSSAGALITEWLGYTTTDICAMAVYMQPMGTHYFIKPQLVQKTSPPLMIYQASSISDKIHHPDFAKGLKKVCDQNQATCELFGSSKNDIQELPPETHHRTAIKRFLFKHWEIELK